MSHAMQTYHRTDGHPSYEFPELRISALTGYGAPCGIFGGYAELTLAWPDVWQVVGMLQPCGSFRVVL